MATKRITKAPKSGPKKKAAVSSTLRPDEAQVPRVLLAEESLPFRRVIREALTAFRVCEVDDAPTGERAFEMALHRPYALFIFSLPLPDMAGDILDRLLSKAYPLVHKNVHTSPPVIFLIGPTDVMHFQELQRDVRVRGSMPLPPKLDVLLSLTASLLPERQGMAFPPLLPPPHVFSPSLSLY